MSIETEDDGRVMGLAPKGVIVMALGGMAHHETAEKVANALIEYLKENDAAIALAEGGVLAFFKIGNPHDDEV